MKIVAIAPKGKEFIYGTKTAHKVPNASAEKICKILNDYNYKLKENEVWFIYDVDQYDRAYDYAEYQSFKIYKGIVKEYKN